MGQPRRSGYGRTIQLSVCDSFLRIVQHGAVTFLGEGVSRVVLRGRTRVRIQVLYQSETLLENSARGRYLLLSHPPSVRPLDIILEKVIAGICTARLPTMMAGERLRAASRTPCTCMQPIDKATLLLLS